MRLHRNEANVAAKGISACFYFMTPLIGISFFLVIFFVKKISLKRADDEKKKEEAKAWVESKKAKHDAKHHHGKERKGSHPDSAHSAHSTHSADAEAGASEPHGSGETLVGELEQAGRGLEQAAGATPPRDEPIVSPEAS